MSGTYAALMGDRGRLVIPAELRARLGLTAGTPVVLVETPRGLVLTSRDQAKALVRGQLAGGSLVDELLADRRAEAAADRA
ncbi:MAG TPA: AbrB/MazE/SpoVT family DNA-binding domain-containing protein [Microlunatus sp.]|nr:AbrB/MazE/SpoVT family DNA-binding domain-containing protein [Microlunatus sp.]